MVFSKLMSRLYLASPAVLLRSSLERIPYSGKFCFVLPEKVSLLTFRPEKAFRDFLDRNCKGGLLPSSDQRVTLVESIGRKLIAALNDGLMLDKAYKINGNVYEPPLPKIWEQRTLIWKPATQHLNGREWEFYVAESMSDTRAFSTGFAKIIIPGELLVGEITADREAIIATLIGYEIGKVVAKSFYRYHFVLHFSELFQWMSLIALYEVTSITVWLVLFPVSELFAILFVRFCLRRNYAEAGHIGLILMASAGYDPRWAPRVYQRLFEYKDGLFNYNYSGDKLTNLWSENEVMKQALEIYEETKAGKGVRKFV